MGEGDCSMEHTPGPWVEVCESGEWSVVSGLDGPGDYKVVLADTTDMHQPDVDLICAAPDLLAACQKALAFLSLDEPTIAAADALGEALRAAVVKATGKGDSTCKAEKSG